MPKGRGCSNPSDYRPVAVLCTPAKVFEAAIHNCFYLQISAHLSDTQYGFRPERGTSGILIDFMAHLVPTVDAGLQVDVAFFDFRKAFDMVNNDMLLLKLACIVCNPLTLSFFASYLRDRCQYVDCNGQVSEPYFTRSGVSQGSTLGPLLFNLMINDLPNVVKTCTPLLFADDLKLVLKLNDASDCECLQQDINRIFKWSIDNKLYFNITKCSVLLFSRSHTPIHHQYTLDSIPLQRVQEIRDLGVHFTADMNFRMHITKICKKAYQNLGMMLRFSNKFTNFTAIRALYDAPVRSHLEYNAVIWSPHEAKYKIMLERIQNKFLRFMYLKQYGVYPGYPLLYPTLFVTGMVGYYKLEVRREVALATYLVRVIRGKIHNPRLMDLTDEYIGRRRRPPLLSVPRARTNLLQQAPLTRTLRVLNTISNNVDIFSSSLKEFTQVAYHVCSNSF